MLSAVSTLATLLRRAGVRVSTAEAMDAAAAIAAVGIDDPRAARLALRSSLVKQTADLAIFDDLFELLFARGGALLSATKEGSVLGELADHESSDLVDFFAERLRDAAVEMSALARLILGMSTIDAAAVIRAAGERIGLDAINTPFQVGFFSYRLQRELDIDAAVQAAQAALRTSASAAGLSQSALDDLLLASQRNAARIRDAIRDHVAAELARRSVGVGQRGLREALAERPLTSLSPAEVKELRREVQRLAEVLSARVRSRRRRAARGRLDVGGTLRRSLASDGVPAELRWAHRRRRRPRLLILCDVSDSVRYVADVMLQFAYSLVDCFDRVDAYAFVADLGDLGEIFRDYDIDRAIDLVHRGAAVSVFASSDYGRVLAQFRSQHFGKVTAKTTVLVIGDGRCNYYPARAEIVAQVRSRARRLLWLCPEGRSSWGVGDSAMLEYEPHIDRLLVANNLRSLKQVIGELVDLG